MPIWSFYLKLNGVDAATLGFQPAELRGHWDSPTFAWDEQQIPRHDGPIATAVEPDLQPKDFVAVGELGEFATEADFEDAADAFKFACLGTNSAADVTIVVGNRDTRERHGVCTSCQITPSLQGAVIVAQVQLTIHCRNPIAKDSADTLVTGASGADLSCALGMWLSNPVITVNNPTSPLTITQKDSLGATVGDPLELTWTGSATTVVIDGDNLTITRDGARHDEDLSGGDFPRLDPRNGGASRTVTLRASSGSGSPAVSISYPKTWP